MKKVYTGFESVTKRVEGAVVNGEKLFEPYRQSFFKRFPIFAPLLVTFGATATFFGIERMLTQITWLNDRPLLILALGIAALILSGKLYQKLG